MWLSFRLAGKELWRRIISMNYLCMSTSRDYQGLFRLKVDSDIIAVAIIAIFIIMTCKYHDKYDDNIAQH